MPSRIRLRPRSTPPPPPEDSETLFLDAADGALKSIDSTGTVTTVGNGEGGGGAIAVTDGATTIPALTSLSVPASTLVDAGGGEGTLQLGTMIFDDSADGTLTIQAPAGQEDSGNLLIWVRGEQPNDLLELDPYGQLTLGGAVIDPTNGGASLAIKNGAGQTMFRFQANDGSGGQGVPKAAFFGGSLVVQPAPIADATDPASTMARLNDLLAALRALGLIDT